MARVVDRWHTKAKKRTSRYGIGKRWQAVWTVAGEERKESFAVKAEAEEHLVWIGHNQRAGTYVSPERGRVLIGPLLDEWVATLVHYKPSTLSTATSDVRATIKPYWGSKVLADIERSDVQRWVSGMDKAGRTVQTIHGRFVTFLEWCIDEGRITRNVARSVNLPKGKKREHIFLTPKQVEALSNAIDDIYHSLIWVLSTTGIRIGEAVELRARDLDLKRKRLRISRAVTFIGGDVIVGLPKNGKTRSIPLTKLAAYYLAQAAEGKAPNDLLFVTSRGNQIRPNNFKRRHFDSAVTAVNSAERGAGAIFIDPGLWVHDLRHTAASWAVQSGASVKSVQRMLGHATAAITLEVYAGLFDQDLDDVAIKMSELLERSGIPEPPPFRPAEAA